MILVGNGDENLNDSGELEPPDNFLRRKVHDTVLNLLGDYRFHRIGYYVSLHAEENNCRVFPSVKNALDVYRAPIFLTRLRKAGFEVPSFKIFPKPNPCRSVVLLPLNPFSKNSPRLVRSESQYYRFFRSLSMNYHYPVVHVEVEGEIMEITLHLTRASNGWDELARRIFNVFSIPLGKILVEKIDSRVRPIYFMPLEREEINLELIFKVVKNENRLFC
ncbi:MAG: RimK-like ATPgrasp N-terminal domain-containing protein [Candidatus Methanomethylicia archaeon]